MRQAEKDEAMDKIVCSIDRSTEEDDVLEGYTDNTTWNGWDNVYLPLASIQDWLDASPYDYSINPDGSVLVYWEDEAILRPSIIDGLTVYDMNGYCFVILGGL